MGKGDKIKSVIVLTVICLVVTALLAVTNHFTAPVIETSRNAKIQESLRSVLPDSGTFEEVKELPEGTGRTVKGVYTAEDGSYAVVLTANSGHSSDGIGITVGISPEGKLVGVSLTSYWDTLDFGRDTYPGSFIGKTASDYGDVAAVAGVTHSSEAFKKAIGEAFAVVELIKGGDAK